LGVDADWIITDAQMCDAVNVNTGTGIIYINPLGNLSLINSANVTCSGLQINRRGGLCFCVSWFED